MNAVSPKIFRFHGLQIRDRIDTGLRHFFAGASDLGISNLQIRDRIDTGLRQTGVSSSVKKSFLQIRDRIDTGLRRQVS